MPRDLATLPFALATALAVVLSTGTIGTPASAGSSDRDHHDVSPILQIEPRTRDSHHDRDHDGRDTSRPGIRSIDGSGNHRGNPEANAAHTPLARIVPTAYGDGTYAMGGANRPGAREVSNLVNAQTVDVPNPFGTSDYLWQWGQFLDHDIDLTEGVDPPEPAAIPVPVGDPHFDPLATGAMTIPLNRSIYDSESGTDPDNPRQQMNEITGWIDASNVYGSDATRAAALRTLDGSGRLAMGPGRLLPRDPGFLPNATGGSGQAMFLAGDIRANEQLGLTAMHTLFVREHNRLARAIRRNEPRLDGDVIYERARRLVGAMMQIITYEEFLPALLGPDALEPYRGYDPDLDPRLANEFSTAAYRFGHSALPHELLRLDDRLNEIPAGHIALRDAFFNPDRIRDEGGIEPLLRGLAHQLHQRIDVLVVDEVRNFLFGPPGAGGFDLASLNIQRGRDHGLGSYNDARETYGLGRVDDFSEISSDPEVQARLASAYASVDDIDLWVGGLAEDALPPSQVGPLVREILIDQFTALRDGDRYWYERTLGRRALDRVRGTRLSDVIRRNTGIRGEIPDDVFRVDPSFPSEDGSDADRRRSRRSDRR